MPDQKFIIEWFISFKDLLQQNGISFNDKQSLLNLQFVDENGNFSLFDFGNSDKENELTTEQINNLYKLTSQNRLGIKTQDSQVRFAASDAKFNAGLGDPVPLFDNVTDYDEYERSVRQYINSCLSGIVSAYGVGENISDSKTAQTLRRQSIAALYYTAFQTLKKHEMKSIAQIVNEADGIVKSGVMQAALGKQDKSFFERLLNGDEKAFNQIHSWVEEYSKQISMESEFERLSKNVPDEQKQSLKNEYARLWSINQCLKDVDYSKGKTPEELFDIAANPKYKNQYETFKEINDFINTQDDNIKNYQIGDSLTLPIALARNYWNILDHSGTEQANLENENALKQLGSEGPEADEFKRRFVLKGINKVLSMKNEIFLPKDDLDAARLWKEHYHDYMLVFDMDHFIDGVKSEYEIPENIEAALRHKSALYKENIAYYKQVFSVKANPDYTVNAILGDVDADTIGAMLNESRGHNLDPDQFGLVTTSFLAGARSDFHADPDAVKPDPQMEGLVLADDAFHQTQPLAYANFNEKYKDIIDELSIIDPETGEYIFKFDYSYALDAARRQGLSLDAFMDNARKEVTVATEASASQIWFKGFKEILKEKGISLDNPLALGLVSVGRKLTKEDHIIAENTNAIKVIPAAEKMFSPAFIRRDGNGKPLAAYDGKNYAEYLVQNTASEPSPEQIDYLYKMAKEGRLFIQSDSPDMSVIPPDMVTVNPDGSAKFLSGIDLNDSSKKYFQSLEDKLNKLGISKDMLDDYLDMNDIVGSANTHLASELQSLSNSNQKAAVDMANRLHSLQSQRYICAQGKRDPDFYKSKENRRILSEVGKSIVKYRIGVGFTKEEEYIKNKFSYFDNETVPVLNKIKKKLGVETNEELMKKEIIGCDGKAIKGLNEFDFLNKVCSEIVNNRDLYIPQKVNDRTELVPFRIDHGQKTAVQSTGFSAYASEVKKLLKELKDTDSVFTNDSESYKTFKESLENLDKYMDQQIRQNEVPDPKTLGNDAFFTVSIAAQHYQLQHDTGKSLTSRQENRLSVMQKFQALTDMAKSGSVYPIDPKAQLLCKIVCEKAKVMQSGRNSDISKAGRDILLDHNIFLKQCREMRNDKVFNQMMSKSRDELQKMLKQKPGTLFEAYTKQVRAAAKLANSKPKAEKELENNIKSIGKLLPNDNQSILK